MHTCTFAYIQNKKTHNKQYKKLIKETQKRKEK